MIGNKLTLIVAFFLQKKAIVAINWILERTMKFITFGLLFIASTTLSCEEPNRETSGEKSSVEAGPFLTFEDLTPEKDFDPIEEDELKRRLSFHLWRNHITDNETREDCMKDLYKKYPGKASESKFDLQFVLDDTECLQSQFADAPGEHQVLESKSRAYVVIECEEGDLSTLDGLSFLEIGSGVYGSCLKGKYLFNFENRSKIKSRYQSGSRIQENIKTSKQVAYNGGSTLESCAFEVEGQNLVEKGDCMIINYRADYHSNASSPSMDVQYFEFLSTDLSMSLDEEEHWNNGGSAKIRLNLWKGEAKFREDQAPTFTMKHRSQELKGTLAVPESQQGVLK